MTRMVSAVLGIGGGGELAKMTITPLNDAMTAPAGGGTVTALFNPAEISRSRSVSWTPKATIGGEEPADGRLHYGGPEPETVSFTLLFDTYETWSGTRLGEQARGARTGASVTTLVDPLVRLARPGPGPTDPPVCRLSWGAHRDFFTGVLTGLEQTLTMFLPNGTPVRASVACTFLEWLRPGAGRPAGGAGTARALRGDSLQGVAATALGDPTAWRRIARANRITDPRSMAPGTVLRLPGPGT